MRRSRQSGGPKIGERVTIEQVAGAAGVSPQTVSRVVNNHPSVAPKTRQRVLRAIARLGYQPNILARSLVHRRSHTLGVVASGLEYYGPSGTLVGIEHQATELGYTIVLNLLHRPHVDNAEKLLNGLVSRQVDGIVWAVPEIGSNRAWLQERSARLPVPVVFLSMHPSNSLPVVSVDNRAGGRQATAHLLAQGYRHIGLITGPADWWEARERTCGWQEALRAAGLEPGERHVVVGDWSASSGEQGFSQLLAQCPETDAVFACNDQMALGVLQTAHQRGLHVPDDLGLVGFDDIPESSYFWPSLTTVRQELRDLGGTAVRLVIQMIEANRRGEAPSPVQPILLPPTLVVRASSVRKGNSGVPPLEAFPLQESELGRVHDR